MDPEHRPGTASASKAATPAENNIMRLVVEMADAHNKHGMNGAGGDLKLTARPREPWFTRSSTSSVPLTRGIAWKALLIWC